MKKILTILFLFAFLCCSSVFATGFEDGGRLSEATFAQNVSKIKANWKYPSSDNSYRTVVAVEFKNNPQGAVKKTYILKSSKSTYFDKAVLASIPSQFYFGNNWTSFEEIAFELKNGQLKVYQTHMGISRPAYNAFVKKVESTIATQLSYGNTSSFPNYLSLTINAKPDGKVLGKSMMPSEDKPYAQQVVRAANALNLTPLRGMITDSYILDVTIQKSNNKVYPTEVGIRYNVMTDDYFKYNK